jgi:hypothetical protein
MLDTLQKHFDAIETHRAWFTEQTNHLTPEAATTAPNEGEWSLRDILEHLILSERFLIPAIEAATNPKPTANIADKLKARVVKGILRNGVKVPVPTERVEPRGSESVAELLAEWARLRERLEKALAAKTEANLLVFEHPAAGPMDIAETVEFIGLHLQYHTVRFKHEYKQQL